MYKLDNKITFTRDIIIDIYNNYSKLAFCDAIRLLIKNNLLDNEEKNIILKSTSATIKIPDFLMKSYIIYLSNAILSENQLKNIIKIKRQLIFELGIRLLEHDIEKKIFLKNTDEMIFSLGLNKHIKAEFDSVEKRDNYYYFYNSNDFLKIEKNNEFSITEDIDLLEDDRNPFNINNPHPDAPKFVYYDLGTIPKEQWIREFRNAYRIIKDNVPEIYDEIYNFLDEIVPHGYVKDKQHSSSYSKSPGILYVSYTDDDTKQAEAIIHEVHHTIFNIIEWKYALINNNMELKYYSAYRPDARHIKGCFIGLHAFVAVQNFYRKLAENLNESLIERFLCLHLKNEKVISVIEKYGDLTEQGKLLFNDIKIKFYNDAEFFKDLSDKNHDIYNNAFQEVEAHLEEAKKRNKILLY